MSHPWEEVPLSEYEAHMSLSSIAQLQCLYEGMKQQVIHPVSTAMVLGVAGGNGLDLFEQTQIETIYGVDINRQYLEACVARYPKLQQRFMPLCINVVNDYEALPQVSLLIANLLIEYIGYDAFVHIVAHCKADIVSCIIQVNTSHEFVSTSPYEQSFVRLHEVHHEVTQSGLISAMSSITYELSEKETYPLPNGKALLRLEFHKV